MSYLFTPESRAGLFSLMQMKQQDHARKKQEEEERRRREMEDYKFGLLKKQQGAQERLGGLMQSQGNTAQAGLLNYGMSPQQERGLTATTMLEAGYPEQAFSLMSPGKPEKYEKDVQSYLDAKEAGIIPDGTTFEQYQGMVKKPLIQQTSQEQPYSLSDLEKIQGPSGIAPPLGLLPSQAGAQGYSLKSKPVAAESAGKQAMMDTAKSQITELENIIFPKGIMGEINNSAIGGAAVRAFTPSLFQPLTGMISEQGQIVAAGMEMGIQGITRIETGAAMPSSEVQNTRRRFQPMPWDHDNVKRQKWMAYKLFLDNTSKYLDPNARETGNWSVDIDRAMMDAAEQLKKEKARPPISSFETGR